MVNPTGYTALDMIGFTDKGTYSSSDNYVKNDLVHYSGNIWRCLVDDTTAITPVEGVNWTLFIGEPTNLVERIIAPVETDPATSAWAVGRQIIFNDNLYEVIVAITAGDALVTYEDDPTNANIKLADPVETQLLNEKATRAAADLALQNALSHRNLIDNAWFTVNQRGQTSYTGAVYTVDRWRGFNADTNLNVTDDGITLSGGTLTAHLDTDLEVEVSEKLYGKTVTYSIMLANGVVYSKTGVMPAEKPSSAYALCVMTDIPNGSIYNGVYVQTSGRIRCQIGSAANKELAVRAVKLELGSISTLAMDTAPNYAEELLKCQRYFFRKSNGNGGIIGYGFAQSTTNARVAVTTPVPLRLSPSVSISDDGVSSLLILSNGSAFVPSAITVQATKANVVSLNLTTSGLSVNQMLCVRDNTASYIDFSADL